MAGKIIKNSNSGGMSSCFKFNIIIDFKPGYLGSCEGACWEASQCTFDACFHSVFGWYFSVNWEPSLLDAFEVFADLVVSVDLLSISTVGSEVLGILHVCVTRCTAWRVCWSVVRCYLPT